MKGTGFCIVTVFCCSAAILLTGCYTPTLHVYEGDPHPDDEVAAVTLPTFLKCTRVDGKMAWDPMFLYFLPGEHSMEVSVSRKSKKMRYSGNPVILPFRIEAGHKYRMRVCFFYVDSNDDIYDPHYYYARKLGGSEKAARHALGLKDRDGWIYFDWLPSPLTLELSWTPYLVDEADGSVVPHPDPKVAQAVKDLLAIVEMQQKEL
ncbi:MAG: hypothetical protein KJ626_15535 [Verrucomicrobia bacterium]|nr:hypothetical protein [Verrucomicrobiota bacterium]